MVRKETCGPCKMVAEKWLAWPRVFGTCNKVAKELMSWTKMVVFLAKRWPKNDYPEPRASWSFAIR
jgi:hypothetical protein